MLKRNVLVVDDQNINRRILTRILEKEYNILEAENGKEALDILRSDNEISAVLLDIVMPVMNGYEVLEVMREDAILSKIPVIVSSQNNGDEDEIKALSLGAQDFIAKPYKADIIKHRLQNTIRLRETAAMVNRAQKDELTGLYNKHFFIEKAEEILAKNPKQEYILLCFGIERFKLVNDTYGVAKGDELLRYIGEILTDAVGDNGICGRFVADSFYAFKPKKAELKNENFKYWIDMLNRFPIEMNIKVHCGVYDIVDRDTSFEVMCDRAQLAAEKNRGMYERHFVYYDDSIRQKLIEEQFITSEMQSALEQQQFQVYYQPKYDLHTEMLAGAEALVRWIHPVRGMLSPGLFIPLFERNGFITQLDKYVWEVACSDIRSWIDKGYPPLPVSVNVSRADIFNPNLPEILKGLVNKYNIPMQYLHLEITESAYTDDPEQIVEVVGKLHDMGFTIEMDDFGSGYSSLNMLAELPVDILKLDMRFVQSETKSSYGKGIMGFVISLAKWMKLSVIAEGVETAEQITALRSMDCNYVQGFYFAKPMPKTDFEFILNTVAVSAMAEAEKTSQNENIKPEISCSGKKEMLVIDDIELNRQILEEIFEREYKIVGRENGQTALEYLQGNYSNVGVILLDLLMPVMDGFQFLIKKNADDNLRDIPLLVTSQGDVTAEERALDLGADDFISKPYSPQVVCHRVHNVVRIYRDRHIQNERLTETEKREQTLMESIPGGVAIYHLKKDGRISTEYVSEGLAKLCGYSTEKFLDYIGYDARENIAPEDLPSLIAATNESLNNNKPIHEFQHIYTKDKRKILVRLDANVISKGKMEDDMAIIYAVHTLVPDETENAIQEQNRYRYILDNLDVAYFEVEENGNFYCSDKYSLYELSNENTKNILESGGSYDTIHPDDLPILFEFFSLKKKNIPKISVTIRLKMKDGTYRWTEMMGFFEYNSKGERIKTIGVLRDVDREWLNQNRKLQEALTEAKEANQTKTDFLDRVSHDMRTPLNGILGLTELIRDKVKDNSVDAELEQLGQSGKYLLNLINDTLDVSIIEKGKMQLHPAVCDGKMALQNVLSLIQPSVEAKRLQFNMKANNLPFTKLYIDVGRVEQAIINILGNAIKFTPEGGQIDLTVENVKVENGIITDKITIKDNGIGMSEEFLEHVFEPFTQEHNDIKSIYRGTGLGMTISKQCVELMGGTISVKSQVQKGTEVTIILPMPIANKEQIDHYLYREKIDFNILKGKRILLCEDHPLNAKIAIKLLESKGMLVEHAENGKIGLEMFSKSPIMYFDAILMDVRMPIMDGLEATRRIRGLQRMDAQKIPIIALTANAMNEDIKNAINAGMSEHLGKPVEPNNLYQTLIKFISMPNPFVGKKILVVDDIQMNRIFVKVAINETYTVIEASSGAEALEILNRENDIAAVVTDIQMPVMDGKELIRKIRANRKFDSIAILANTIYGDHHQEEELLELGADDFVYKPTSPKIILMRLEHILRNMQW